MVGKKSSADVRVVSMRVRRNYCSCGCGGWMYCDEEGWNVIVLGFEQVLSRK